MHALSIASGSGAQVVDALRIRAGKQELETMSQS